MHIFKPIKLKKKPIVWYIHRHSDMMSMDSEPTHKVHGHIIAGEKHEAMTQPLWHFPFSLQIIKCSKGSFAMGVTGKIVTDLYHLRIWKKDNIILTLRFHKRGNIIEGFKKYGVDKNDRGYPHNCLKGKTK